MTVSVPPFESEQHALSKRWAVVEDDGDAAWLYLSEPGSPRPVAACFLYDREVLRESRLGESVTFKWSSDGHSVAALFDAEVVGFLANATGPGFSRSLKEPCTLGNPLDDALYQETFRAT